MGKGNIPNLANVGGDLWKRRGRNQISENSANGTHAEPGIFGTRTHAKLNKPKSTPRSSAKSPAGKSNKNKGKDTELDFVAPTKRMSNTKT